MALELGDFERLTQAAVRHYWATLAAQGAAQGLGRPGRDYGNRAAVTGGKQMDGFCELVKTVLVANGVPADAIKVQGTLEIPGYFRAEKKWDLLVVYRGSLLAAVEFKSQRGPSFGNNLNNRAEEAVGVAVDALTAYREKGFGPSALRPWFGWLMFVEECDGSTRAVGVKESFFPVFPEFKSASYLRRYELLLRRLRLEKLLDSTALIQAKEGSDLYTEPAEDLGLRQFLAAIAGHVLAGIASIPNA